MAASASILFSDNLETQFHNFKITIENRLLSMHRAGFNSLTLESVKSLTDELLRLQNMAQNLENSKRNQLNGSAGGFQIEKKDDVEFYADVGTKINDICVLLQSWATSSPPLDYYEPFMAMKECYNFLIKTNYELLEREYLK
jgi:hypothetical protein